MATVGELLQFEQDFVSGRNPLAYIPLCHALRRSNNFSRALEICQRGVQIDPTSVAGRTLLARLLGDLGRYEEALREIVSLEESAPEGMGVLVEKAKCLIKMRRLPEAERTLRRLNQKNPMDPQVQVLNRALRELQRVVALTTPVPVRRGLKRLGAPAVTTREILDELVRGTKALAKVKSLAVVPLGAGEPALEGQEGPAESAFLFFREVMQACKDLTAGSMRLGLLETDQTQLIVLVRQGNLISLAIEPSPRLGKIYHRFLTLVGELLPETS